MTFTVIQQPYKLREDCTLFCLEPYEELFIIQENCITLSMVSESQCSCHTPRYKHRMCKTISLCLLVELYPSLYILKYILFYYKLFSLYFSLILNQTFYWFGGELCVQTDSIIYALQFRTVKEMFQNIHHKNGVLCSKGMRTTKAWQENNGTIQKSGRE